MFSAILFLGLSILFGFLDFCTLAWISAFFFCIKLANFLVGYCPNWIEKVIHWIHAMTFEFFVVVFVFLIKPLGLFWKTKTRNGNDRPILLVHGYINSSSVWIIYKYLLPRLGFGPIYMVNLKGLFSPIEKYVHQVKEKAQEIERETGIKELILIGHSMGGLVSSLYTVDQAPTGKVTDLITIGSPLKGTKASIIGVGKNAKQMSPDSTVIFGLAEKIASLSNTRVYLIVTKTDQLIIPYTSGLIKSASIPKLILCDIGHVSLLFSKRVFDQVVKWLRMAMLKKNG